MGSPENKILDENTLRPQKDPRWSEWGKNAFVSKSFFLVDFEHSHSFFGGFGGYRDRFAFTKSSEMPSAFPLTTTTARLWFPLRSPKLGNSLLIALWEQSDHGNRLPPSHFVSQNLFLLPKCRFWSPDFSGSRDSQRPNPHTIIGWMCPITRQRIYMYH